MTQPQDATASVLEVRGASPYDVVVGRGVLGRIGAMVEGAERVAIISPERFEVYSEMLVDELGEREVAVIQVPEGEAAKDIEIAAGCWDLLGNEGFTRSDVVVTLGGGATTDLGGFVAAGWLRGVRVVHVPTSLLAMVDAAVGGKTGVNTASGKNLVGAFHEPAGVICDLAFLDTLAPDELVAGMAEVVKCGFIADPEILRLIEGTEPEELTASSPVLRELVERAIRVKIDVVVDDLTETAGTSAAAQAGGHPGREALNYGHTLGHAIERASDYQIRHGEAVAVGCVFVAELARRTIGLSPELVERHRTVLERVGLPTSFSGGDFDDLLGLMRIDKKARGSQLRFVVLDDLARPRVLAGPSEADLRAAFEAVETPA